MKSKHKSLVSLQIAILLYSLVSVLSKVASIQLKNHGLFSFQCIGVVAAMIAVLGIYALIWQKSLKKMELSIAYANKGVTLIWSLIWSILIFNESIGLFNIIGILIILFGIVMVNAHE